LNPLVKEIQPSLQDIVKVKAQPKELSSKEDYLADFRNELVLAIESLALEYAAMFNKEMT
jgi:hypothetical protein